MGFGVDDVTIQAEIIDLLDRFVGLRGRAVSIDEVPSPHLDSHRAEGVGDRGHQSVVVAVDSVCHLDENVAEPGGFGYSGNSTGIAILSVPDFPDIKTFSFESHLFSPWT